MLCVDGASPGIFSLLPAAGLAFNNVLSYAVFTSVSYPESWTTAWLFTILRRRRRKKRQQAELRKITEESLINSITKLYTFVLCAWLQNWFIPYRERGRARKGL